MNLPHEAAHSNGRVFASRLATNGMTASSFQQPRISHELLAGGRRSLCGISSHAFGLGTALGLCLSTTIQMTLAGHYLWRLPFFVATLSIFHYLEFDMTARYNPLDAKVTSFLLFSNGRAYNIAHTTAIIEVVLRYWLMSHGLWSWSLLPGYHTGYVMNLPVNLSLLIGLALIMIGQLVRSLAMKHAGTNFNHVVQSTKKEDHVLVTQGVYKLSRHPAYFGFFWWAIGTQLVLGNYLCLCAYSIVLWKFFSNRIFHEEKHLTAFFGKEYSDYKSTTPVFIPFIR